MLPPVVDPSWLREHRNEVVLADVRWYLDGRSGRAAYDAGHLPGAVFVDLDRWLAGPAGPRAGRHPLPEPEVFAEGMSALGIEDRDAVVAYDDAGGVTAARLVWMLRASGHDAALLDGGLHGWDGELTREVPDRPPANFTPRPWPTDRVASIDDATSAANVVLDARSTDRYRGEHEPVDPRPGHVPGARSLPCRENLDAGGRFLPVDELRRRFAAAGVGDGGAVVSYCGSGVTACHNLLALEHAGLGSGRLYPGSWSQYSHDHRRPPRPATSRGFETVDRWVNHLARKAIARKEDVEPACRCCRSERHRPRRQGGVRRGRAAVPAASPGRGRALRHDLTPRSRLVHRAREATRARRDVATAGGLDWVSSSRNDCRRTQ